MGCVFSITICSYYSPLLKRVFFFRNDCLSPTDQLLLTLNFYGNGSFLRTSSDLSGVSKSTGCRVVRKVSVALASLRAHYIKMPDDEEIPAIRQAFYEIARFPRCIGAVDGTHIKIQSPGCDNAEMFRNRKQFFSINVQTVADPFLKIRNIVARWPGSSHDSYIFRNSVLCQNFENGMYGDSVLLGDSGYALRPYLITPLLHVRNEPEALFNEAQIRTRNVVERQIGVWKRRFPALSMGLRLSLDTIQATIVATAVLHNIACIENEQIPENNAEQEAAINFVNNMPPDLNVQGNNIVRNNIIRYFGNL